MHLDAALQMGFVHDVADLLPDQRRPQVTHPRLAGLDRLHEVTDLVHRATPMLDRRHRQLLVGAHLLAEAPRQKVPAIEVERMAVEADPAQVRSRAGWDWIEAAVQDLPTLHTA